ncbi:MAG TPA: SDR family oxidoreductase [Bryobacteraceae bacterium]|jgi:NAD(P)-dependent dehydrogenase (short-subunit alcohol dehydrogenase family)|nr:SDR family oxidoreductase [Bryobacteraceae bacterium]
MPESTVQDPKKVNPKEEGPKPTFQQEKIPHPGSPDEMNPKPDHGEESYRGFGRLEGKVALVTGGDSGIGRAVSIAFAREGADLALSYLPEEEKDASETIQWIKKAGRKELHIAGSLCDQNYCKQLIEQTIGRFGRLDLLINIAGYQSTHDSIEEFTDEEFDRTWKTNVYALFWLCRAALPHMKEGSAIINTASIQAFEPSPNLLPYAATKSAIVSMTKTLSHIAMKKGVRVNAVAPGPVWTPLIPATMPEEKVKEFGKNTDFGRPAQPVELAPLYVFLASNESRYVTGEVYGATGGRMPY